MPDGKTFLEAGGVVDEIVDVRAEEASTFAGPFARRLSQRLIATRVSLQFAVTGTGMEAKVQQKNRAAAAVMGGHHSDHADRSALKTQPKP